MHMQRNPKEPLTKATWSVPELSVLDATLRKKLAFVAYEVALDPDEVLWRPGTTDPLRRHFGIVLHGCLDIFRGDRFVDVVRRHEALGISALVRKPHTAVVKVTPSGNMEPTRVLLVDAAPFAQARRGNIAPEIEHAFFRVIVRGSAAVISRLNAFALMNPYQRFIETLLVMADEQNTVWHSQRHLAQLLDIDIAQISRYVKYLTNQKALTHMPGVRCIRIVERDGLRRVEEPDTEALRGKR